MKENRNRFESKKLTGKAFENQHVYANKTVYMENELFIKALLLRNNATLKIDNKA